MNIVRHNLSYVIIQKDIHIQNYKSFFYAIISAIRLGLLLVRN